MKVKKKTAMLVSFILGASLFATTTVADIANKSGYEQLKDAMKTTAADCTGKFKNYTLEMSITVTDNGKNVLYENHVQKYDLTKNAAEKSTKRESEYWQPFTSYSYSDKSNYIARGPASEAYYVTTSSPQSPWMLTNPFKDSNAQKIETIADAVLGSVKDYVVVTENPDGSKILSGSLSDLQIPAEVNAACSYYVKTQNGDPGQRPNLTQDIHIKTIKGRAVINKSGTLEGIMGSALLSGKDNKGQVHEVNLVALIKLTGINSTTVAKPDLSGKEVFKQEGPLGRPTISNRQKFLGKYKNDIVIAKDGRLVKIGEKIVEVTRIDDKSVAGRYHEEYKSGFAEYAATSLDFSFKAEFGNLDPRVNGNPDPTAADFTYSDQTRSNLRGSIRFHEKAGKVFFGLESKRTTAYNNAFSPVFE